MTKRKKLKGYIQPKITRIILDPTQAILQQCAVGGVYFMGPTQCMKLTSGNTGSVFTCNGSVRGQSTYNNTLPFSKITVTDARPS